MVVFSPQPLKNGFFLYFRQSDPPGRVKIYKCAFLQWILKDDDVYFHAHCFDDMDNSHLSFLFTILTSPF